MNSPLDRSSLASRNRWTILLKSRQLVSCIQSYDVNMTTDEFEDLAFHIFQYFVSVVSTTYIDAGRRLLNTNQYSVTDMSRVTEHGRGVPGSCSFVRAKVRMLTIQSCIGIFFKYDIEPMHLTIRERTTTFLNFLVRLAGIIGGVLGTHYYIS